MGEAKRRRSVVPASFPTGLPSVNVRDPEEVGVTMVCDGTNLFIEVGGIRLAKRENCAWTPLVAGWLVKDVGDGIDIIHDVSRH